MFTHNSFKSRISAALTAGLVALGFAWANPASATLYVTQLHEEVESGGTATFVVLAADGYTRLDTVGGTCPPGTWGEGNEYTTGSLENTEAEPIQCSVTFSATANTYTLRYHAMGGTLAAPSEVPVVYDSVIEALPEPTRAGYRFLGWNTSPIGDGDFWEDGLTYIQINDVDLFAIWEIIDTTPPEISAIFGGQPFTGGEITSIGALTVEVSDAIDSSPVVTGLQLTGGPSSINVSLNWSDLGAGVIRPSTIALMPSDGAPYTLTVTAQDFAGNQASESFSFNYTPIEVGVSGTVEGVLRIPAVDHAFSRAGGSHAIDTAPIAGAGGQTITGQHDVYASVSASSDIALVINGISVAPGQMVLVAPGYDFSATGGRVTLPLSVAQAGVAGDARLTLSLEADAPVVSTTVRAWTAGIELDAPKWSVVQLLEPVEIDARVTAGTVCRIARTPEQNPSPITDPVCVLEWTSIPAETRALSASDSGTVPGIRGYAVETGANIVAWTAWVYDVNGDRFEIASGQTELTVLPAFGQVELEPSADISSVYILIQNIDTALRRKSGFECVLTTDASVAKNAASRSDAATCLVEWLDMPEGLGQALGYREPRVRGNVVDPDGGVLSWRVSMFSQAGTRVDLNEQSYPITAINPPVPQISFLGRSPDVDEHTYSASMAGGYLTDVEALSLNAALTIRVLRDGAVVDETVIPGGWGETNRVRRRINTDARSLWSDTPYRVEAFYTMLPEVMATREFSVLAVPSTNIRPEVQVNDTKAIDTELFSVTARIMDGTAPYNVATMADWKVRIIMYRGLNEIVPLTEFVPVDANGEATFDVDLSDVGATSIRIAAQAELVSPAPSYARTVESMRPAYITILRGAAIDSSLSAGRLSGEAPFSASITLDLSNRLDSSALGAVAWQVKFAEDGEWEAIENASRLPTRLLHTFSRGTYWIRAVVENRHSGQKFVTPELEIIAYHRPKPELVGPGNIFIGDTGHFNVSGASADEPLVVQWSYDGGKTWVDGETSIDITRSEAERFTLVARTRYESAPAEDQRSWVEKRKTVNFVPVRPPRLQVIGPLRAEAGREHNLKALTRPPYQDMEVEIDGEWTLPDGTKVSGVDLNYTPSESDVAMERITLTYTAWVVGYKDDGAIAEASRSTRVWKYVWPEFGMLIQHSSVFAPADFKVRVDPKGSSRFSHLEGPTVTWELPPAAIGISEAATNRRDFTIAQAGEYVVKAIIRDARGNEATIEQAVSVLETPPYDVTLGVVSSNSHMRVPVEIRFRPSIAGGHPRDRIMERRFFVNGTEIEGGTVVLTEPGIYELSLEATSRFGFSASGSTTIETVENQLPVCEIEARESGAYMIFTGRCQDPDGRVAKHRWIVNDSELALTGYRISVRKDAAASVTLSGIDDSGEESDPVHWP